jgi:hypothetical protein
MESCRTTKSFLNDEPNQTKPNLAPGYNLTPAAGCEDWTFVPKNRPKNRPKKLCRKIARYIAQ